MTSCSQISTELSNLSNDIEALDNKFVLKTDYTNKVNDLQRQITELANKIAAIKPVDESSLIEKIKNAILPFILSTIFGQINPLNSKVSGIDGKVNNLSSSFEATLRAMNAAIGNAQNTANTAKNTANIAKGVAESASDQAIRAAREASLASGLSKQAKNVAEGASTVANTAKGVADTASGTATVAKNVATNADGAVKGLKGVVNGLGNKVNQLGNLISKVESVAYDALVKGARALGISENALKIAGRALGRVLELAAAVAQILTLIEQLAVLETLGARIDAVERQVDALANSVSQILGKLLGLQRRIEAVGATVPPVRNLANQALIEGLNAGNAVTRLRGRVDNAESKADSALTKANQAQATADGAARNAATANANATTAYKTAVNAQNTATTAQATATQAKSIGQRALEVGGTALNKAGEALGTALTAIALYQTVKGLRGLRGERGLPGLPGKNGRDGLPGKNGIDGITRTFVVQVPGQKGEKGDRGERGFPGLPGAKGAQGLPGLNGRDGKDVNPAQIAELKAFIANQHQQTRGTLLGAIQRNLQLVLQAISAISNAAMMGLLNIINNKLGAQVVGGISGSLGKFYQWAHIDRALNLLTFAATVHNGVMLSNDIAQTLTSALSNVLSLIGIKDKDGNALNLSSLIGSTVENAIKGIIGAENYTQLTTNFAKANRIYQSSVNVLNSFQNLTSTVLNALEITAGRIGKIGNALRKSGEVLENAYGWMNPQPKFNKITTTLENLQNGASTIQMVTQAPLDVIAATTELTEANTAFVTAIKEDDKPLNIATPEPEPDILKAAEAAIKTASAGSDIEELDLEADE